MGAEKLGAGQSVNCIYDREMLFVRGNGIKS